MYSINPLNRGAPKLLDVYKRVNGKDRIFYWVLGTGKQYQLKKTILHASLPKYKKYEI